MIAGFEFGSAAPLHVRHERVQIDRELSRPCRLVYASDLHLTARRGRVAEALLQATERIAADAVLLGGDLLDRGTGAPVLESLVRRLAVHAPLFAVAGNHDGQVGRSLARDAVLNGGGNWLHDAEAELPLGGARLQLHASSRSRSPSERACVRVLVGHHPKVVEGAAPHYDVVLAGHLHGGQCVWWQRRGRLYPGAWFSRWTGLRFRVDAAELLVSRGVADTLPLRFRCPREVIVCELASTT